MKASLLLAGMSTAAAIDLASMDRLWLSKTMPVYYADGSIVARLDSSNPRTELGDYPAKVVFPLSFVVQNVPGGGPADTVLLARMAEDKYVHDGNYTAYTDRRLFVDYSPGAHPVGFVADNATLGPRQTTWGFSNAKRFITWTQAGGLGEMASGLLRNDDLDPLFGQQAWAWVETSAAKGVYQLYWNQTRLDERPAGSGSVSQTFGLFFGLYSTNVTYASLDAPRPAAASGTISERLLRPRGGRASGCGWGGVVAGPDDSDPNVDCDQGVGP